MKIRYNEKKVYLCKMNMKRLLYLYLCVAACVACNGASVKGNSSAGAAVDANTLVVVDGVALTRGDLIRDIPKGWTGEDSLTFAKMYVDNWVLKQLKMSRANDVLPTYEESIERLVEDYRQSLIMRQLDQYYIDNDIDHDVTDLQVAAYYKNNKAQFKLGNNVVKGVIVKVTKDFKNKTTLTKALTEARASGDIVELMALSEKLSLDITDLSSKWNTYADFLGYLPTVRTRNYDHLLSNTKVQNMPSDDALFYFIFTDVARKGSTSPLELVEEDIKRKLYAERRSEIVAKYEDELRREALSGKRISFYDEGLEQLMSYHDRLIDAEDAEADIIVEEVVESEDENENI